MVGLEPAQARLARLGSGGGATARRRSDPRPSGTAPWSPASTWSRTSAQRLARRSPRRRPTEYTSAVSIMFTPASSAISICRRAPSRSVAPTLRNLPRPPNVIVPIVSFEMRRPERPSCRYSICVLLEVRLENARAYGSGARGPRYGRSTILPRVCRCSSSRNASRTSLQRVHASRSAPRAAPRRSACELGEHVDAGGGRRPLHLDAVLLRPPPSR